MKRKKYIKLMFSTNSKEEIEEEKIHIFLTFKAYKEAYLTNNANYKVKG